jgi:hypothetical protein
MSVNQWLDAAGISALMLEFAGAVLMANALLNVTEGKLRLLFKSLYRSQTVIDHAELSDGLTREQKVKSLQGLAFIALGFLIDLVAASIELTRTAS